MCKRCIRGAASVLSFEGVRIQMTFLLILRDNRGKLGLTVCLSMCYHTPTIICLQLPLQWIIGLRDRTSLCVWPPRRVALVLTLTYTTQYLPDESRITLCVHKSVCLTDTPGDELMTAASQPWCIYETSLWILSRKQTGVSCRKECWYGIFHCS